MAYDGAAVKHALLYSQPEFLSEDKALYSLIEELIKADKAHHKCMFLIVGYVLWILLKR